MSRVRRASFMFLLMLTMAACRARPETAETSAQPGSLPLFQCQSLTRAGVRQPGMNLSISAQKPEDPRFKPEVFITIGDGARVKSQCGERRDLGKGRVFACWYSGGGLTVAWPAHEPQEEEMVRLTAKRLFGALSRNAKLRCTREDTLDAVRQAAL